MSLHVNKVELDDFRNFNHFELVLDPGITILMGSNAVGKTNCVEALQLLTSARSFRKPTSIELVRQNADMARIALDMTGDKRHIDIGMNVTDHLKRFTLNGKKVQTKEIRGILPSVLFYPDDLKIVKGSASNRREEIDNLGLQMHPNYSVILRDYERALSQRNILLKSEHISKDMLNVWTEALVKSGSMLILYRNALYRRLREKTLLVYGMTVPKEIMDMRYVCSFTTDIDNLIDDSLSDVQKRTRVAQDFWLALEKCSQDEQRRRVTLVGPHLDDIEFFIEGKSVRKYASQGQQRSVILALKLAQTKLVQEMLGYFPILLLDDVMSELDRDRRSAMFSYIDTGIQTVITTTNIDYFDDDIASRAKVVHIDG